jgi:molybdopterin converting factor small subunit
MIEIKKLDKPNVRGVSKIARFNDCNKPVEIENPTVVNAVEELLNLLIKEKKEWMELAAKVGKEKMLKIAENVRLKDEIEELKKQLKEKP